MNKTEAYDWINDPNHFKVDGHIPPNRCYHCGYKFVGAKDGPAFCSICDNAMTPYPDEPIFVIVERPIKPTEKQIEKHGVGKWVPRSQVIANRIRIPEEMDEETFKKKFEDWNRGAPEPLFRVNFTTAKDMI